MEKIVALFETQSSATQAMDELMAMHLQDLDTAVYEGPSQDQGTGADTLATPNANLAGGFRPTSSTPPLIPNTGKDLDLDSEDDEQFFREGYQQGGTLVIVEARKEDEKQVRQVLARHGGRFTVED